MTTQEARELQEVKSRCESNTHQLNEVKVAINELQQKQDMMYEMNTNIKLIAQSMTTMQRDVNEVHVSQKNLEDKVAVIENRPDRAVGDAWSKIKVAAGTALVTGLVAYVLGLVLS